MKAVLTYTVIENGEKIEKTKLFDKYIELFGRPEEA